MNELIEEIRDECCAQADCLGMESLTENQQALVDNLITFEKYAELEGYNNEADYI